MKRNKKISIVANHSEQSQITATKLNTLLVEAGFSFDNEHPDLIISVGGDGTLLKAFHDYEDQLDSVRFTGIHTGHLGFYTDFVADDADKLIEALKLDDENDIKGTTQYPLLKVTIRFDDGKEEVHRALNESTIRRTSKTLVTDLRISDYLFEKFRGDGLSVSTPTGSTAYNKSIGGAVMHPQVEAMQIAEIASLNNIVFRTLGAPMVVAKKDTIRICPEFADDYRITIDQYEYEYKKIKNIEYELDGTISFANYAHTSFWERVRNAFIGEIK